MIHHTCDRCRRVIDPEREPRYEVRIETQAIVEPRAEDQDANDDRDHLLELHQILEEEFNASVFDEPLYADESFDDDVDGEDMMSLEQLTSDVGHPCDDGEKEQRYDLCAECYASFMANPIARDLHVQLGFSEN